MVLIKWRQVHETKDVGKHYLPIIVYKVCVNNILERYPDLHQELSNKASKLSTDISSVDLDSANNHLIKINVEDKRYPQNFQYIL